MRRKRQKPIKPEFDALVVDLSDPMLRSAAYLLRDPILAKDVVQEAFIRTYTHWDRAQELPRAYAWTTLMNLCRDQHRRWARHRDVLGMAIPDTPFGQELMEDRAIESLELDRIVRSLPDRQREVVVLRYLVGMSVSETAGVLGMPTGTVKSTCSRAIATLRANLGVEEQEVRIHVD